MARRKIDLSVKPTHQVLDMSTGAVKEPPMIPLICERVRTFRERLGIEQKSFAERIGVTGNAVSNWERGRSRPDVNLLPAICRVLGITLYDLFGEENPSDFFSEREKNLVSEYRALSLGNQYAVDKLVETLGFVQAAEHRPELRELMYFERSLAAGTADPTEFEQEGRPIFLYASPEVDRADYVFTVNGDSMEPDFCSGDRVLVQKASEAAPLRYGEIGAFIVGNETYMKRYEKDGLHSINPRYETLRFDEEQSVYLIGRVLQVLPADALADQADVNSFLALRSGRR